MVEVVGGGGCGWWRSWVVEVVGGGGMLVRGVPPGGGHPSWRCLFLYFADFQSTLQRARICTLTPRKPTQHNGNIKTF